MDAIVSLEENLAELETRTAAEAEGKIDAGESKEEPPEKLF